MSPIPFLTITVVNKRDVLVLRQRARQVAGLLHLTGFDRTYVAAAAFAIGSQARQLGLRKVGFAMPVVENPTQETEGDKGHSGHQH